jgi:hypothetical protein
MNFEKSHTICDREPRIISKTIYKWFEPIGIEKIFNKDIGSLLYFDEQRAEHHEKMKQMLMDIRRFIKDIEEIRDLVRGVLLFTSNPNANDHIQILRNINGYLVTRNKSPM